MLVLKIVGALALLGLAVEALVKFHQHCEKKFNYPALSPTWLSLWQLAALLGFAGWYWERAAAKAHGDILNGLLFAGAGILIAAVLTVRNFRCTNLVYGPLITLLQLPLAVLLVPPFSIGFAIGEHDHDSARKRAAATRVRVVNRI